MASMEIYEPLCETEDCGARATRKIVGKDGKETLTCTKHSATALKAQTEKENGKGARP